MDVKIWLLLAILLLHGILLPKISCRNNGVGANREADVEASLQRAARRPRPTPPPPRPNFPIFFSPPPPTPPPPPRRCQPHLRSPPLYPPSTIESMPPPGS
ncbi:hypothetical protein BVRB_4g095530 [Beta vulgaris subsp. vulgaris]|uniref:Uncharacterized protein n=1 Tax=Beta vulgaris subsp. vulgaris TaxID=3555 RepID=A0A0J8BDS2_BETVV|nr:hypothetical protein BVRB_4g095530 [Beta vulgaris subsp. vulgaris]